MCNVDLNSIEITDHFYDRVRERVGIPKRATKRLVKTILSKGLMLDDIDHESKLYKTVNSLVESYNLNHLENNRFVVLYREYVVVFQYPNIAVTILHASEFVMNLADKYIRRKMNGCNTIKSVS